MLASHEPALSEANRVSKDLSMPVEVENFNFRQWILKPDNEQRKLLAYQITHYQKNHFDINEEIRILERKIQNFNNNGVSELDDIQETWNEINKFRDHLLALNNQLKEMGMHPNTTPLETLCDHIQHNLQPIDNQLDNIYKDEADDRDDRIQNFLGTTRFFRDIRIKPDNLREEQLELASILPALQAEIIPEEEDDALKRLIQELTGDLYIEDTPRDRPTYMSLSEDDDPSDMEMRARLEKLRS